MSNGTSKLRPDALSALLKERGILVADGGMGTSLFELGIRPGESPEAWNTERPDAVAGIHRGFVEAGADIILTNTFGGTRARLELDGREDQVNELNSAGVEVARGVASNSEREVIVAGSVGPTGMLFAPLGALTHDAAVELFTEQMDVLVTGGVDVIWIETLSSIEELEASVEAARRFNVPVVTTMSFDSHGKTMMGVPPSALALWWHEATTEPTAIGANCGIGPADVVTAVEQLREADPDVAIIAKANCGVPELVGGELRYPSSTEDMYEFTERAIKAGARIIGACCGSMPSHVAQIRSVVDRYEPTG